MIVSDTIGAYSPIVLDGRSLEKDLHSKISISSIWMSLQDGKLIATSNHRAIESNARTYFVLEGYFQSAAKAIGAFVSSLVR